MNPFLLYSTKIKNCMQEHFSSPRKIGTMTSIMVHCSMQPPHGPSLNARILKFGSFSLFPCPIKVRLVHHLPHSHHLLLSCLIVARLFVTCDSTIEDLASNS